MAFTAQMDNIEKELDFRSSDGLEVWLLWCTGDEHVVVEVIDTRVGDTFRLEVELDQARDAFEHPYAYAAFRGIEYAEPRHDAAERSERTNAL
jgi:hypothetical protein